MNQYIYDALDDIERRIQTILDDIRSIKEQVYCPWVKDDPEVLKEDQEAERLESLGFLANNKK